MHKLTYLTPSTTYMYGKMCSSMNPKEQTKKGTPKINILTDMLCSFKQGQKKKKKKNEFL